MLGHVCLEFLGVGVLGWLPSRLMGLGIEVVREILGVGMSHLPVGRKACVGLLAVSA